MLTVAVIVLAVLWLGLAIKVWFLTRSVRSINRHMVVHRLNANAHKHEDSAVVSDIRRRHQG